MTLSDHAYHGYALITNAKFWAGLPADVRTLLEGAVRDATEHFYAAAKVENDEGVAAIRKSGHTEVITLTPQQRLAWKKAMLKTHEEMADRVGLPLIQSIYKETGFDPSKL
jgi:C4-dicarboxylate-binding protein DctP